MPDPAREARTSGRRRRLILHGGTPKSGTSALQVFFAREYARFKDAGILYPLAGRLSPSEPKHQWLARTLRDELFDEFDERMATVEAECDERTHTIVLSTEGLYNLWPRYGPASKAHLAGLVERYAACWWLWFRDPAGFCASYYVQSLWNPRSPQRPEWGRDLDVSEFLALADVAKKFDYRALSRDMESVFGTGSMYGFAFGRDIAARAVDLLGLPPVAGPEIRENVTVTTEAGVRLLRALNRYPLDAEAKGAASAHVTAMIGIVGDRSERFTIEARDAERARELCTMLPSEIAQMDAESESRWRARERTNAS